jgi:hypothetical protein
LQDIFSDRRKAHSDRRKKANEKSPWCRRKKERRQFDHGFNGQKWWLKVGYVEETEELIAPADEPLASDGRE